MKDILEFLSNNKEEIMTLSAVISFSAVLLTLFFTAVNMYYTKVMVNSSYSAFISIKNQPGKSGLISFILTNHGPGVASNIKITLFRSVILRKEDSHERFAYTKNV